MNRKILIFIIIICVLAFAVIGCSKPVINNDNRIKVITTLFPQYDFVRHIGGDKVIVDMLLPPGMESHMFDPKPGDIGKISSSDLFIYTGENMEPWAERIISSIDTNKVIVVDASKGVELHKEEHEHHDEDENEEHDDEDKEVGHAHEYDPHIWLDPELAKLMVDNITEGLCQKDPVNKDYYTKNAKDYKEEIDKLEKDFTAAVTNAKRNTIVFGGRFAFAYFVEHYNLEYKGAYDSCSTEAEPSVQTVVELIGYIKSNKIPAIYHEELVDPKVARSIAEQTGAELLLLHTAHNVSKSEMENGITYIKIMRNNLENLKKGLN
jgi:zinc transport system substrate-binding protein